MLSSRTHCIINIMLRFDDVSFGYSPKYPVFSAINLEYDEGVHLLLGPNGSGKTTLLHLAAGLLCPQAGYVDFDGCKPFARRPSFLSKCFLLEENFRSPFETPAELATRVGVFYPSFSAGMLRSYLEYMNLGMNMPLRHMSLGMGRKANAAFALAVNPDLLMLDEPANGMDIAARHQFQELMTSQTRAGQTVIVSTHSVQDFAPLYNTVTILTAGNVPYKFDVSLIAERLAFIIAPTVPAEAVYADNFGGIYRSIVPATDIRTEVNFDILYCAMISDSAPFVLNLLNQ